MEMNNNAGTTMMLSISNPSQEDLYDYVDQTVVPLLEQISSVAEVEAMGGKSEYYKIELQSDEMAQYQVTMSDVSTAMSTANLSYPSGDAVSGKLELSVSTSLEHETIEALKEVPITTSSGKIVYLEDIARVYEAEESRGGISLLQRPGHYFHFHHQAAEQHGHGCVIRGQEVIESLGGGRREPEYQDCQGQRGQHSQLP